MIRTLHDLDAPPGLNLPDLQPFGSPGDPLPELVAIPEEDSQLLHERIEWARTRFLDLPYVLPR